MKKSEIDQHIRKYILPNHSSYYVDQHVIYKPFGDDCFIKGYLFYSKGDNEMGLKVTYFVMPLFVKEDRITYTLGGEIYYIQKEGLLKKSKNVWWDVRKDYQSKTFEQINKTMDEQAEPILKKFNSAKDFYELHKSERKDNIRIFEAVTYATIFMSDRGLQEKMLRGLIKEAENERDVEWVHQIKSEATLLLQKKDIEERKKALKSWANETIGHLKLPHLKPLS